MNYILLAVLAIFIILVILVSLFWNRKNLSPKQFLEKIKYNNFDFLLDVRTPQEWEMGHHQKAILTPIGSFVSDLPKIVLNKNAKILIYCKRGIRAEASAKIANRLGYNNVWWLDGTYDDLQKLESLSDSK